VPFTVQLHEVIHLHLCQLISNLQQLQDNLLLLLLLLWTFLLLMFLCLLLLIHSCG
jgi:hypothetical protein